MSTSLIAKISFLLVPLALFLIACEKKPVAPALDNPFDSENPVTGGDPFALRAELVLFADQMEIKLTWQQISTPGIENFKVYRSSTSPDSGFTVIATVRLFVTSLVDRDIEFGKGYWYKVSAVNGRNEETNISHTVAAFARNLPLIRINNNSAFTGKTEVTLQLIAKDAVEMLLANTEDFAGSSWEPFRESTAWRLPEIEGVRTVYLKTMNRDSTVSPVVSDDIILDLTPPQVLVSVTPDSGINEETIFRLDPSSSRDNFTPQDALQIRYDWEDDGVFDTDWRSLIPVEHTYSEGGGDRFVRVALRDLGGTTADLTLKLFVNSYSEAAFSTTQDASTPERFTFDASNSTDLEDGSDIEVRWDFESDGSFDTDWLTAKIVSYEFMTRGFTTILLQVRDRQGLVSEATALAYVPALALVPAGAFTMGQAAVAAPQHPVTLTQDFYLGVFEVTNAEAQVFFQQQFDSGEIVIMGGGIWDKAQTTLLFQYQTSDVRLQFHSSSGAFVVPSNLANHPVENITWFGAASFCNFVSQLNGLTPLYDSQNWSADLYGASGYRLPTEAEWEYTARFDDQRTYPWGDQNPTSDYTNVFCRTFPVGSFFLGKSKLGLYDLAGNVHEWCNDWFGFYQDSPAIDPTGPASGRERVYRGGACNTTENILKAANRSSGPPNSGAANLGFRVLLR